MEGGRLGNAPPTTEPAGAIDIRDMLEVHQALRREFGLAPAAVRATAAGDVTRAKTVAGHIDLLCRVLAVHHGEEDRQLWPALNERVPEQLGPVIGRMEAQHAQIHHASECVAALLPRWAAAASPQAGADLAGALGQLCTALEEHLTQEEEHILPLAAQHLTQEEWDHLGADGFAQIPRKELPLIVGMLMYQGNPEVIALMLAHAPAAARLVLPVLAPRVYARYARRVHLTATP